MPRDIPVGNGSLLITFDDLYQVRDLYYPQVGRHNHTIGHIQRFGVWADGEFAWISDDEWTRDLRYKQDTLVTEVRLEHPRLGLAVMCNDAVDFHEPVYFRRATVKDLRGEQRDVRLFYHVDLSINGSPVADTANYDPQTASLVCYKDESYFLINAGDQHKCGIDHWAIGHKKIGGAEGTWRDAEDGLLGRNAISQGSVDATVGFNLDVPPFGEAAVTSWIACGDSYADVRERNDRVWAKGPDRMLSRTEAYWKLWARKEPIETGPLPEAVADLMYRSMLILRTQIDNGGAIIAA
ncbi:MAG: glycoside hydrolase family 15 protein, partial [Planctomycetota bacterium]